MEVSIVQRDLEHLDQLDSDTLLLFLPEDDGPLVGLAGLVDWRLTGRLSRYLVRGWLSGEKGEKLLMPSHGRVPVDRLVGVGIGKPDALTMDSIEELASLAGRTLADARSAAAACAVPGEPEAPEEMKKAFSRLRKGLSRHFQGRLVVLGDTKILREALTESIQSG